MGTASCIVALCGLLLIPGPSSAGPSPPAAVEQPTVRLPVVDGDGLRFSRLSTQDGLSQTRVAQIVQDDQGFIWFGTQYGLNRYDGYDFKVFVNDARRPESLGAVFVTALFKDRSGSLWVGGAQTLDRFDPATESFEHVTLDPRQDRAPPTVVHISQDQAGAIWFATGAGLYRREATSGTITRFGSDPDDPASLASEDVRFSGEDREGGFWVGTAKGLDRFDRSTGQVTLRVPLEDPVQIGFFEDRLGNFWIMHASGDGLALLDRETATLTPYSFYDAASAPTELTGVMAMVEDDDGALWIGSPGLGLLRFDLENRRFVHHANNPSDDTSIAEDKVIALFRDREGNVWVGQHSVGPSRFNPRPPLFETFRHEAGNPDSLEMNFVNAMFEDSRGTFWIGNDLGLTQIDRRTGHHTRFRAGLGRKPMVITIAEDSTGAIWVGTYGSGIARLDEASGTFMPYVHDPDDPGSLCNNQVHELFLSKGGNLWAGTDDGLCQLDPQTGRFTTYKADWSDRRAQAYVSFAEDRDGILWLGTHYSGLHRFDPASGEIEVFSAEGPGHIRDNMVPTVHIAEDGALWVGTQSGLDRFEPGTGVFTQLYDNGAAPGRTISNIQEDRAGTLWISSNQGLLHFDPRTGVFKSFTAIDGLPGNDLTGWSTGHQSPSGEMFFGGFAGGIAFFPDRLVDASYLPPVILTDLQFPFLSPEAARANAGPLAIGFSKGLTLGHEANSLSLSFSALSYVNPSANRYRYKLEGLDDHWREVDSDQRVATFTTLPAGAYVFRVQGATARGDWSEPGVELPIRINPPWWATWWFRAGAGSAVLGLVFAGFRLRVAEVENREREFRKLAENAPDMVMRFDSDLRLRYANPAARAFARPPIETTIGRSLCDAESCYLPVRIAAVEQALRSREQVEEEFEFAHGDRTLHLECRVVPEYIGDGPDGTALVITRDITRRKNAEAALRKSEADLAHVARVATVGELTASIAHEVNQPLTGIVTNGEAGLRWLRSTPPNLEEVSASVGRIIRDGRRAADIITRIGALVRKAEPEKRPLDLNDTILEILPLVEGQLGQARVDLQLDFAAGLPPVRGDRVQVQQVVLNLMKNAIEAMADLEEGPRLLQVSSACVGNQIEIVVRDTGTGLPADSAREVFDAFFSTKGQGMGMGLAISRAIVESHGGAISAEPGPTQGAVFRIVLPVSA